uniref:Unspecific monooxygenase n=1 Tax=Caenorhabditis tropicalis TaxID=1561998 RepID=A0A1I7U679_9PELO
MANLPMVFVTDWKLIKQHFIKEGGNFVGRPEFPINMEIRKGAYGIIESFGDRWIQQRRFTLHILRDFGLGKNLMEEKVLTEVTSMIERLKLMKNDVDMQSIFDSSVGSIINSLLFGYRFDETNMAEFLELKGRMNKHFKLAAEPIGGLVGMYPWLGRLPYFSGYKNVIMDNWAGLLKFFRRQAEEKLSTIDYDSDEYSDYVEAFLKERKKHEHEPGYGGFEMEQLDSVCFDLWVAGMETTSNTLYWSLLYVLLNPKVLEKVYEELDSKIGTDRIITTSDRPQLNYINATINESQRLANLLPMNLSRTTTVDVEIGGYRIPKDTVITPQISSADSPGNPELRPSSPGCRIPECRLRPKSGFQRVGSAHRRTVQKDDGAPDRGEILD